MPVFTPLTPLPTAPSRSDEAAVFVDRADAFAAAMEDVPTEYNASLLELEAAFDSLNTVISAAFTTTSVSSVAIGTGAKSFTVEADLSFIAGQTVMASYDGSNYMVGTVTSYSGTSLVLNVTDTTGAGTYATWAIALSLTAADLAAYVTLAGSETLTNKTLNLASNTLTGTTAEFNTALSDDSFATLAGSETLTNKTITGLASASTVKDSAGDGHQIGYRDVPLTTAKTAAYTLALADVSKTVPTDSAVEIPSNATTAFPVGSAVYIYNDSASAIAITIDTDTLRYNGTALTGSRTLAAYGIAWLHKVGTTTWLIGGGAVT